MNARQFFDEVARLRELQKKYFKERSSTALTACRRQEKKIDEEISRVRKVQEEMEKQKEPMLF